jgi:hypothetical protein
MGQAARRGTAARGSGWPEKRHKPHREGAALRRVFSSRGATTPRPLRLLFDLLRKPAEFIGNIGGTEGQIAQTIGGLAQED